MSKLRAVIRHEYLTVVKQKGFWAYMLSVPLIFLVVFLLIGLSTKSENSSLEQVTDDLKGVAIVDASGLINPVVVSQSGQTLYPATQYDTLKEEVAAGSRKGLIYYPQTILETRTYEVYVSGVDFLFNTSAGQVADSLLKTSLYAPLGSPQVIQLAQLGASGETTTYVDGEASVGYARFIVPGIIAAMFFIILMFSIGYILTSIADEKENRSMEMALTYVSPRTLIIGKLISVVLITLTQLLFFALLAVAALSIAVNTQFIQLPNVNLADLPIDPVAVAFGLGFLIVGFVLFAAVMAFIAALLPAKQANNWSALFYILPIVPLWFLTSVATDPSNQVVQFITYFPLTAPMTNLIRNTVGNIPAGEAALSLAIMTLFAAFVLWCVIKVFPKGALEFQNALSLKSVFSKK
jgi:ABC-2 type transport system permease protein